MGVLQTSPELRGPRRTDADARAWFPEPAPSITSKPRRKILIVEDAPSISNILHVLLGVLNYEGEVAMGREQALAMIERENYDAVLLDLRNSDPTTKPLLSKIREIRPSLADRVLVITGEVEQPRVVGRVGRRCLPPATDIRLMENVHRRLLALWDPSRKS